MDREEVADEQAAPRRFGDGPAAPPFVDAAALASASSSVHQGGPISIRLFDPNGLLALIAVLFWPLRFFPVVLIPTVPLAALTMFKHWNEINAQLHQLLGVFSFVIFLLLNLLIINLAARLAMGAVVRASGGTVRHFGFMLFLGIIPRFYIDRSGIPLLPRRSQLWAYATPLIARVGFFAFGMLGWATYRSTGTWGANHALLISQAGLWTALFAIAPLLPGDSYNWFATFTRQPLLRQKALMVLSTKLRGGDLPRGIRPYEAPILIVFAVGVILAIVGLALLMLVSWGVLLAETLQGIGAVLLLLLITSFVTWIVRFRAMHAHHRAELREARLLQAARASAVCSSEQPDEVGPPRRSRRWLVWGCIGLALIGMIFLPHSYDPAGPFEILPTQRSKAEARTDGEVVEIRVHEGDWVNAGQVLAHLSSVDQRRDVSLTRGELEIAQARLAQLEKKTPNTDGAMADMARRAAHDEVERLRYQLDNDEAQLERTTIRAPAAGAVTTPSAQLLPGVWLNAGDEFVQIDDTTAVEAEIAIPQDDIALIKPGATVWLRPWSEGNRELIGHVISLAPNALGRANSNIVTVKASVGDHQVLLRPGMTGYAKISGPHMTIGEAYRRLLSRFLTIGLWSWVP